jgi:hypothetical protein
MDTIDSSVMAAATIAVEDILSEGTFKYVHTVYIVLNGEHGGADLIVRGFKSNDVSLYNERTIRREIH